TCLLSGTPLADHLSQLGAHAVVQVAVTSDGDSLRVGGGVGTGEMFMGNVGEGEVRDSLR
ncbi:MAG: hypothetical protein IH849_11700, partial [Acidobacteria bacterium]|nr:hypothetical protein [Acidobacteriota bacterium]